MAPVTVNPADEPIRTRSIHRNSRAYLPSTHRPAMLEVAPQAMGRPNNYLQMPYMRHPLIGYERASEWRHPATHQHQIDRICAPHLTQRRTPAAVPNGGSVRVLLGRPVTPRNVGMETRTFPGAWSAAPRQPGLHPPPGPAAGRVTGICRAEAAAVLRSCRYAQRARPGSASRPGGSGAVPGRAGRHGHRRLGRARPGHRCRPGPGRHHRRAGQPDAAPPPRNSCPPGPGRPCTAGPATSPASAPSVP